MKKVLVLGANGFIGQNICHQLLAEGNFVIAADKADSSLHSFFSQYNKFNVVQEDFSALIKGVDAVIYLVSTLLPQPSNEQVERDVLENLIPVIHLLEAMKESASCKKIIFASSGGTIYGNYDNHIDECSLLDPKCSYGIMKLTVEKYLSLYSDLYSLQTLSLRLSNPYGPGQNINRPQGAVGIFLHKMLQEAPLQIWGDGSVVRDYVYIDDVAAAFSAALNYSGNEKVFNIGSSTGTSLNELLDLLFKLTASKSVVTYSESRTVDVLSNILSVDKAKKHLGWAPSVSLKEGLIRLISLIRSRTTAG